MDLTINGKPHQVDVDPETPVLWVLRDIMGMTGTKYGCGRSLCGACTIHLDGRPIRSCSFPVGAVSGEITTIEGLGTPEALHEIQKAWIEHQVAQCGYCQSGQIMSAAALLSTTPDPTDEDISEAMAGNICRCGTYPRIKAAILAAAANLAPPADFLEQGTINEDTTNGEG